jgi:lambda repressor-like predicted transcriptional regulator
MKKNSRFVKVALASGIIVTSGAAALGITSFASAQGGPRASSVAQAASTDSTVPGASGTSATLPAGLGGADGDHGGMGNPFIADNTAKVLGLTTADLQTKLQSGSTLADLAKAANVSTSDLKAAVLADIKAHLAADVKSGEHTQADADAELTRLTADIDNMINGVRPAGMGGGRGQGGPGFAIKSIGSNVAKVLNTTAADIQTKLQSGSTLADLAKAANVSTADLKAAVLADVKAELDADVTAGKHTQAEADAKLAEVTSNIDNIINGVRPADGPDGDMGGMHGGDHGAHFIGTNVAKVLNTTAADLQTKLQSGSTLADLAKAANVSTADLKAAVLADVKADIAADVAAGKHTQAEGDAKLAEVTSNIDNIINGVRPANGRPDMGGMGRHAGRGHDGFGGPGMGFGAPAQGSSASNTQSTTGA